MIFSVIYLVLKDLCNGIYNFAITIHLFMHILQFVIRFSDDEELSISKFWCGRYGVQIPSRSNLPLVDNDLPPLRP